MFYKVRDLINGNFLNQYIMHYLNHILSMFASYGDKPLAQLSLHSPEKST